MPVLPLLTQGEQKSVVTDPDEFERSGSAILIINVDRSQFADDSNDCNVSYDLRIGGQYRDHRDLSAKELEQSSSIDLLPGNAVVLQTEEEVQFPIRIFGLIMPRVTLLQQGIANTPTKVDPGYRGRLLITAFNHGKRPVRLKRGERFCSMFLHTVGEGIRPYKKGSKQLTGQQKTRPWQRIRDLLEANIGAVTAALIVATLLSTTVSISLAILYFFSGVERP